MKIAAWITIVLCILVPIVMFSVAANMGPDETKPNAGIYIKMFIAISIALAWAIRTLKKEYSKSKETQENAPN